MKMTLEDDLAKQDAQRDMDETKEMSRCLNKTERGYKTRRAKDIIINCYACNGYDVTCPYHRIKSE